ncbi:MAG: hypothetical protein PHC61_00360 [Chitinivibrionales bacterium]|nr:hypothetical protein [Chitinivibrionales bacterium]
MMNQIIALVIIIFGISFAYSETTISGKVGGMTLDSAGSPYIVTGDLSVGKGKTLTLKPGCVLLFRQYTGLIVDGSIVAEGSRENPIAFTSANDNKYNDTAKAQAQSFDWNGLTITQNAKSAKLTNFILCYSVFGLKSQTEKISVSNGVFHSNGQFNFTVNEHILNAQDNFPYSYQAEGFQETQNKTSDNRFVAPVVTGIAGLIAVGATAYFFIDKSSIHNDYDKALDPVTAASLHNKEQNALTMGWICAGVSAVLVPVSAILFIQATKPEKKTAVSVYPIFNKNLAGVLFSASF